VLQNCYHLPPTFYALKQIAEIQGHKKQKVEHSGSVEHTGSVVVYLPDNRREKEGDE
jgi:hypothetical protein